MNRPAYKAMYQAAQADARGWERVAEAQAGELARIRAVLARHFKPEEMVPENGQIRLDDLPMECFKASLKELRRTVSHEIPDGGFQSLSWRGVPVLERITS